MFVQQPHKTPHFNSRHRYTHTRNDPTKKMGLAQLPVSDVFAPACANGVWPLLRRVSVAQNKPSTMSSSTVQSVHPPRTTRPGGSGRWDNRKAAQHLPRYLDGLAVDKRTRSNERRRLYKSLRGPRIKKFGDPCLISCVVANNWNATQHSDLWQAQEFFSRTVTKEGKLPVRGLRTACTWQERIKNPTC